MIDKLKINKLILVEGKYDKIRLENIVDADIFVLNGFSIFKNNDAVKTIKKLAGNNDILLLTDSDVAGYKIRVYLSKVLSSKKITHVFIPQIEGKEKRKDHPSAQGLLGVEGVKDDILLDLLKKYSTDIQRRNEISITDLYRLGYVGVEGAKERKNNILKQLGVQTNISNTFFLRLLNERYSLKEFEALNAGGLKDD